jgi:hypothetical protein
VRFLLLLGLMLVAWRTIRSLFLPLLVIGGVAAGLGHRFGAYVLIADVLLQVFGLVAVSYVQHRHVMARPWPQVAPLTDDDWDE